MSDKNCHTKSYEYVICEDLLSAKRLAEAGYCAIPLLGTYLSTTQFLALQQKLPKVVYVWLDNDAYDKALEIVSRLSLFTKAVFVRSDKEPKELSKQEIRNTLRRLK